MKLRTRTEGLRLPIALAASLVVMSVLMGGSTGYADPGARSSASERAGDSPIVPVVAPPSVGDDHGAYLAEREAALAAMIQDAEEGRRRALEALDSHDHRRRSLALRALGHVGEARDVARIHAIFDETDREIRILAGESLARSVSRGAVDAASAFPAEVLEVAEAELGIARFVHDAIFALADAPRAVSWSHARSYESLVRLGRFAKPALVRVMTNRYRFATSGRCHAAIALGRIGGSEAVPDLLAFLVALDELSTDRLPEEFVPQLRAAAVAALTLQGAQGRGVVPAYLEAADNPDELTRVYGSWGLFDVLPRCTDDEREAIREAVKEYIFFDSDQSALSTLVLVLQFGGEPEDAVVIAERLDEHARLVDPYLLDAAWSLGAEIERVRETFERQLESRHPASRVLAASRLGREVAVDDVKATLALLSSNTTGLPDPSSFPARSALLALSLAERTETYDEVIALAKSTDDQVRSSVAFALGRLGNPSACETLAAMHDDRSDYVRFFAAQSLGMLGDARAADGWIDALASGNTYLMENAIASLEGLAGTRLGFDERATSDERLVVIDRWRAWLESNRSRIVAREGRLQLDNP